MLTFRTIDLAAHTQVVLRFRDESIRDGGGTLDRDRSDRQYLGWLRSRIAEDPRFAVHAWKGDAIVGEVGRRNADLIVMGSHGRRGVSRLMLGSDAERVLRTAPVPVLVVRGPAGH